jgi:uncharacterized protein YkwD
VLMKLMHISTLILPKSKHKGINKQSWICVLTMLLAINSTYGFDENRLSPYEEKLLRHINQYRVMNRLNPLSINENLNRLAKSHSQYMYKKSTLNHDAFDERFKKCRRSYCVENVGWNWPTPEVQLKAWKNSRGHNANLLNKKIKYAGISKVGTYVTFFACN